jgi:glycosyltransferase involved in cell wall biosynthesis
MIVKANSNLFAAQDSAVQTVKTLHLINGEHFSGAERVQDLLALALPEFGYEVGFACLKPDKFPEVRNSESELHELTMSSRFSLGCFRDIVDIAKRENYQVLHAHTPRTLMIGALASRKLKVPLVYHVHSPVGRDSCRGLMNRLNGAIEKLSLRQVSKMICVSSSLGQYMAELGHAPEKLAVVPNGVELVDDLVLPAVPKGTWKIGCMALYRPRKGTEVLLEALKILKDNKSPVRLRAVGPFQTEAYQEEVLAKVEELGVGDMMEWTGFQTDVNEQLAAMDVFVLPSLYGEGLPMVVLEAMANAVPVVASNVEGIPEAVRDGVDGMIFEAGDAEDLANKLSSLVGNEQLWESMSRSALERQRTKLSNRSMAQGVATVYDGLLK